MPMPLPLAKAVVVPLSALRQEVLDETDVSAEDLEELDAFKPRTRPECRTGIRPCPFVSCRHHLYLEVTDAGSIKFNFPDIEVWEMEHSCALDMIEVEPDGMTLGQIGAVLNLSREPVRKIQERALDELAPRPRSRNKSRPKRRGRRGPHHSTGTRNRAMEALVKEGMTLAEVHSELGVSKRTLRDWRDGRSRWSSAWLRRAKVTQAQSHGTARGKEDR